MIWNFKVQFFFFWDKNNIFVKEKKNKKEEKDTHWGERESLKLKLKFNFSNFSLFLSCDSLVKREFLFHHPTNLSHNPHNQPNHNSNNRKRTISLSLSLSLSFHFPNFPFWISSSNPNSPPTSIPIFSFQSLCLSQKIFNSKFHSLSPNLRSLSLSLSLWICLALKKTSLRKWRPSKNWLSSPTLCAKPLRSSPTKMSMNPHPHRLHPHPNALPPSSTSSFSAMSYVPSPLSLTTYRFCVYKVICVCDVRNGSLDPMAFRTKLVGEILEWESKNSRKKRTWIVNFVMCVCVRGMDLCDPAAF